MRAEHYRKILKGHDVGVVVVGMRSCDGSPNIETLGLCYGQNYFPVLNERHLEDVSPFLFQNLAILLSDAYNDTALSLEEEEK